MQKVSRESKMRAQRAPNSSSSPKENALRLLNRISAQFYIGSRTGAGPRSGALASRKPAGGPQGGADAVDVPRQVFVANTEDNLDWIATLPREVLSAVSLERIATDTGELVYPPPSESCDTKPILLNTGDMVTEKEESHEIRRPFKHTKFLLSPLLGDIEHWTAAADFCRGYLTVIEDSYPKARNFDLHTALTPFRQLIKIEKSEQTAWSKYYTAAPMAWILQEDLPSTPSGEKASVFFGGNFRKFMHLRSNPKSKDVRNYRNCFNLLQAVKKACPELSKDFILKAYRKHQKLLSTPVPHLKPATDSQKEKYTQLWGHCSRQREKWQNFVPSIIKAPGSSATLEARRKDGGGSMKCYFDNRIFDNTHRLVNEIIVNRQLEELFYAQGVFEILQRCVFRDVDRTDSNEFRGGIHFRYPPPLPPPSPVSDIECDAPSDEADAFPLDRAKLRVKPVLTESLDLVYEEYNSCPTWSEVFETYDTNLPSNHTVGVEGIVEPLKLRTITKGPYKRKWLSQPLQREMADCLDKMWQFTLNTSNSNIELITHLNKKCIELHTRYSLPTGAGATTFSHDDYWWCSGDYQGATDAISIHHTKASFEAILVQTDRLNEAHKQLFRDEMYEQTIEYPKWTQIKKVLQQNGQLMGSVLSFPVLCAINFVAYWESLEEHLGVTLTVYEIPCLIHGDDILFRTTKAHYKKWEETIERYGLTKSVGKNYFHPRVFTIDSELWIQSVAHGQTTFKKYLPMNCKTILQGRHERAIESDGRDAPIAMWDKFNSSIVGSQDPEYFLKKYLCNHKTLLRRLTHTPQGILNMFLPQQRGGMGFRLPFHPDRIPLKENGEPLVRVTPYQNKLASSLATRSRTFDIKLLTVAVVATKPEVETPKPPKMWSLPWEYSYQHEADYPRSIPGPLADPVLSEMPTLAPDTYEVRKPRLVKTKGLNRMMRFCAHPEIGSSTRPSGQETKDPSQGNGYHVGKVFTYPTSIFEFPYIRVRNLSPEDFWGHLVVGYQHLRHATLTHVIHRQRTQVSPLDAAKAIMPSVQEKPDLLGPDGSQETFSPGGLIQN